jgi:acyl-CoA thioesterase YciA
MGLGTKLKERSPAIRVILMPRDTNEVGTIFGGVIMSLVDQAGAVEARKATDSRVVTVCVRELVFKKPVRVGDIVSLYTTTKRVGTTSVTVKVEVEVQRRHDSAITEAVTEAELVFVAVDDKMEPTAIKR